MPGPLVLNKPCVRDYIEEFGVRKVEADALVAEWKPNPAECEVEAARSGNCVNFRFGSKADIPRHCHLCPVFGVKRTSAPLTIPA